MFIAFSAECKLSASFLECTQCQMLSDLAVFTSNREECAKHCVWCGYFQSGAETEVEFTVKVFISTPRTEDTGPAYGVHTGANSTPLEGPRTPSQQPYSISRRAGCSVEIKVCEYFSHSNCL